MYELVDKWEVDKVDGRDLQHKDLVAAVICDGHAGRKGQGEDLALLFHKQTKPPSFLDSFL